MTINMKAAFCFFLSLLLVQCDVKGRRAASQVELLQLLRQNRERFVIELVGNQTSDFKKAEMIVEWLTKNLEWKETDYKERTVQQIIDRGGGNCSELAAVTIDLLQLLNLKMRKIKEINLHVSSDERQKNAKRKIEEHGNKSSVFGRIHNDHVWLEVYDQQSEIWCPLDPSLGLVGINQWIEGRAALLDRVSIDPASNDMIIPIGIFSIAEGEIDQNLTQKYVVNEWNKYYSGRLEKLEAWDDWSSQISHISSICQESFSGSINLHDYEFELAITLSIYQELKMQYEEDYYK
ncbi:MAG: transglutaminase domain-containing protein [Cyclobacteriaceae bacterium]